MTPTRWSVATLAVGILAMPLDPILLPVACLAALLWWGEVQSR